MDCVWDTINFQLRLLSILVRRGILDIVLVNMFNICIFHVIRYSISKHVQYLYISCHLVENYNAAVS